MQYSICKNVVNKNTKFTFTFGLKYLLAVCVHNHPRMTKNPPSVFFFLNLFLRSSRSDSWLCDVTHVQAAPTIVDGH